MRNNSFLVCEYKVCIISIVWSKCKHEEEEKNNKNMDLVFLLSLFISRLAFGAEQKKKAWRRKGTKKQ